MSIASIRARSLFVIVANVIEAAFCAGIFLLVYPVIVAGFLVTVTGYALNLDLMSVQRMQWLSRGVCFPVGWLHDIWRGPDPSR